jgi:hypothetical protein
MLISLISFVVLEVAKATATSWSHTRRVKTLFGKHNMPATDALSYLAKLDLMEAENAKVELKVSRFWPISWLLSVCFGLAAFAVLLFSFVNGFAADAVALGNKAGLNISGIDAGVVQLFEMKQRCSSFHNEIEERLTPKKDISYRNTLDEIFYSPSLNTCELCKGCRCTKAGAGCGKIAICGCAPSSPGGSTNRISICRVGSGCACEE